MGITYITGRAGVGKSFYAMSQIRQKLDKEEEHPLILIVPEQFTLQAERDLIEKQGLEGIMRAQVLSFTRLGYKVFNEVGGLTKTPINEIGKNMIIKKILETCQSDLKIYKNTVEQRGFVSKLEELICEFKQQNISPLILSSSIDRIDESSILKMKLEDISMVYSHFESYLENRYIDNEDHLNLLIEHIDKSKFIEDAEIWIDGFHVFTPQTLRIIEKLMSRAREVHITFTLELEGKDSDKNLFEPTKNTYLKIKEIAEKLNIEEKIINLDLEKRPITNKVKEIMHIESEFFRYPYRQYEDEIENLKVFSSENPYSEIENVAAEIIRLARERKYRFNDMAVVTGDLESYDAIIKRVFEEYGIPYFMDEKRSIMNNPIIELILASLEIIIRNYRYQDIFKLIKTGFTNLTIDEGEIIENYALQYGIRGSQWLNPFVKGDEDKLEELNIIRDKLINPLAKLRKKIKKKSTTREITTALFEYLQEMEIEEKLNDWIEDLKESGRYNYVNENTQIWNTVMEIFDQIYEILEDEPINLKDYYKILESGFDACEIGVIPSTIDQVLVGNIERSRSQDIKALFVIGVNDGILPSIQEDGGILLDHERKSLEEIGMELRLSGEGRLFQENFTIYSAFSKPSGYLWISYSLGDEEGRAKRPSILIDRFKRLFPRLDIDSDLIKTAESQLNLLATASGSFKYLVENMRLYLDDKPMDELWWDVYHWYYTADDWKENTNMMIEGLFHKNQVHYINRRKVKSLYNTPIKTSVSRLEKFVNCPFAHFITYGLRPKERKEYEIQGPDIGSIFHYAMDRFARKTYEKNMDWMYMEKYQSDEIVEEVMQDIVQDFQYGVLQSTYRYKYLAKRLTRISKKALWTLIEHIKSGDFVPFAHEIAFGEGQFIPSIVVELDDGEKIYLEGRIDRVDILKDDDGEYFKVIDYKSGNKDFNLSDVYYGFQLQLIIYLEVILSMRRKSKDTKTYPAGIFYFKIHDPMVNTPAKAVETVEKEINKKLKMKGLVLKDINIIKSMDKDVESHSQIIPVSINKNGSIGKVSSVATAEDFQNLIDHVESLIKEIGKEILKGNIKIEPCKKGQQISCKYCDYQSICQFDTLLEDNKYKNIQELNRDEVLKRIKSGEGDNIDEMD
ncbi:MAG: helicase-exonuclease AddAB subunit AddB [Clostridiales bacterium]|nr:helicase-exonuclease AddAB subunit AddB [Clostridiales bacterium]